jgi:hypothetical protein
MKTLTVIALALGFVTAPFGFMDTAEAATAASSPVSVGMVSGAGGALG